MFMIVITIILLFVVVIALYYGVCHIIKLWTGCDEEEAVAKLHNFFNGQAGLSFENDSGFVNNMWYNVRNIIGDKRFDQLMRLSQTAISTPLLFFGIEGGLPFIAVCVYYNDENEKRVLQVVLTNLTRKYLKVYGYDDTVVVDWKMRYDLNMPYLEIRYARNKEERRILDLHLSNEGNEIITRNSDVNDDDDDEDLQ